ncbi:MAG TPA: hypothetical protein VFZ00_01425 [Solirubrobacter sp.]|nr:hypothetical protein [Solirubrobacter sp.]
MLVADRIVRGTRGVLRCAFLGADGTAPASSPAGANIEIVHDDDTVLVASTAASPVAGQAGVFEYTLPAAKTADLALLTARWTATVEGESVTIQTPAEVCGGVFFTIAQVRQRKLVESKWSDADVRAMRTIVEDELERACGVAFVPRLARDTLSGTGTTGILLPRRQLRTILAVTVDQVALTVDELAELKVLDGEVVYRPGGWARGVANIEVTYEHGFEYAPGLVPQAALDLLEDVAVPAAGDALSPRATSVSNEQGVVALVTAGVRGAIFSTPSANGVVNRYGYPAF